MKKGGRKAKVPSGAPAHGGLDPGLPAALGGADGVAKTPPFTLAWPKRPSRHRPFHGIYQRLGSSSTSRTFISVLNPAESAHLGSCCGQVPRQTSSPREPPGWLWLSKDLGNLQGKVGRKSRSRTREYNLAAKGGHGATGLCSTSLSITTQPHTALKCWKKSSRQQRGQGLGSSGKSFGG